MKWNKEDDAFLRKHWRKGAQWIAACLKRSLTSVYRRGTTLKLTRAPDSSHALWSDREVKVLLRRYPREGGRVAEYLIDRTPKAARLKARRLGIEYESERGRGAGGKFEG